MQKARAYGFGGTPTLLGVGSSQRSHQGLHVMRSFDTFAIFAPLREASFITRSCQFTKLLLKFRTPLGVKL